MTSREAAANHTPPSSRARAWIARLLLLVLSFAAMAFVFELGLRLAGYEAIYSVYSKPSLLWRKDTVLGWHHEPNRSDVYVGPRPFPIEFETPVEINSLGLRGPELGAREPGGQRVLFLGDSVVAGFEVRHEETFVRRSALLAEHSLGAPVEAINGGVRGYGTDQSLLYYTKRGRGLRPDLVVFVHSLNDPRNNMTLHRQRRPFGKAAFALRAGGSAGRLELVGVPVPDYPICAQVGLDERFDVTRQDGLLSRGVCGLETRLADHSALLTFVTLRVMQNRHLLNRLRGMGARSEPLPLIQTAGRRALRAVSGSLSAGVAHAAGVSGERQPRYALTSRLLLELASEVRADGARLLILIRPSEQDRIDAPAIRAEGAVFRSLGITAEMSRGRPVKFVNDAHFNVLGHELAAGLIAPTLVELLGPAGSSADGRATPRQR